MRHKIPKDSWTIGLKDTALVVVDMQRAFVDPGALRHCVGARGLVPKINELAHICRRLKIPVIFVKGNRKADLSDSGLMADMYPAGVDTEMTSLEGKKGNEFCSGLVVEENDYIVHKIRYSALIPGSSNLEALLRGLGVNSFMICGVATDVCVGATTMDGMMLGFKIFLIGDLTATFTEERQRAALETYDNHFAKVITFNETLHDLARLEQEH